MRRVPDDNNEERRMKYLAVGFLVVMTLLVVAISAVGALRLVAARFW
jgi:hypothetical protein